MTPVIDAIVMILVWGVVATLAMNAIMFASQNFGWSRLNMPFLLGTMFTDDRRRASVIGFAVHFGNGLVFSLVYAGVFAAVDRAGWLFGLALGAVHAAFVGSGLVTLLLPAVHPRMGDPFDAAGSAPLLEPPGFMLVNYGRSTMAITLALQLAFGAIVGAFAAGL